MNVGDLPAPAEEAVPAAEPVAPEVEAQENAAEADENEQQPAAEAVPVVAQQPSSASPTQQPEAAVEVVEEPLSLEDAVRVMLVLVKAHRKAGDADLESAIADVEAAIDAAQA